MVWSVDVSADLRVTITDIRRAGYCASGARRWFGEQELDFRAFLKDGIAADQFLATGDAMAERVVAMKLDRAGG